MGRVKKMLSALRAGWEAKNFLVRYAVRFGVAGGAMTAGAISAAAWGGAWR